MNHDKPKSGGRYVIEKEGAEAVKVPAHIADGKGKDVPNPQHADYPKPPLKEEPTADTAPVTDAKAKAVADGTSAEPAKK